MNVWEAIQTRRSIRQYEERPVEEDKLRQILEAMRLAPSAMNAQNWRFFIITDPKVRAEAAPGLFDAPALIVAAGNGNGTMICGHTACTVDLTIAMTMGIIQAQELGLGTCLVASIPEQRVRDALGLPTDWRIPLVATLGYPAETPAPRPRKPAEQVCRII